MLITILVIAAIIIFIIYTASKNKIPSHSHVGIQCEKCGSTSYRFLWDKQIIANDKHLEAIPSGFSNRSGQYRGASIGMNTRSSGLNLGVHGGSMSGRSEHFKYKEVSVKTFTISCKCKQCGAIWKTMVSEDTYPEIKKIPTIK